MTDHGQKGDPGVCFAASKAAARLLHFLGQMYKAVIFDLDSTLYDYDVCHAQAREALCCYAKEHLHMEREEFIRCREENIHAPESRLGIPCAAG